jgi:secreted Zn-dependent insulinase-like peptidase
MLFGVQSPSVSASQLVEHIRAFINTLPALIETADLPTQRLALQNQLDTAVMDVQTSAEMLWQAHLAGHGADYTTRLQHSFAHLHREDLLSVAKRVALSCTPLFCLSNRAGPRR